MDEIRRLQLAELEIFKEFIRICDKNELRYFAIAGTALGAVRHGGFIPWDDDIDVSMPRQDFNRFLDLARHELPDVYSIRSLDNDEQYTVPFPKIVDRRIKIGLSESDNAFIDIFPGDGLPERRLARYMHVARFLVKKALFTASVFDQQVDQFKKRPFLEAFTVRILNRTQLWRRLNPKRRAAAGDRVLSMHPFEGSRYCSLELWGHYKFNAVYPTAWIGDGVMLPFEDIFIRVPRSTSQYLAQLYGTDYMKIPSPRLQHPTHSSGLDFRFEDESDVDSVSSEAQKAERDRLKIVPE